MESRGGEKGGGGGGGGGGALCVEIGFYADISCSMMIPMDLRQIVSPLW